jgi:hypothetical protein
MQVEESIPLLEEILGSWTEALGPDRLGYRNHVYRVSHFCLALRDCSAAERDRILVAACFHDLGIWANGTIDYLPPSIALAKEYLRTTGREEWSPEIELMIDMHHKLRRYRDDRCPLVEVFRKGDLVDVSLGAVRCGLAKDYVRSVRDRFPNAGFHRRLAQLAAGWFARHPLSAPPFLKW